MSIGDAPLSDLARTQQLLLQLVSVLSPLASEISSFVSTPTSATAQQVSRPIFTAQQRGRDPLPSVRVQVQPLPTLRQMQGEVKALLEALQVPGKGAGEGGGAQPRAVPTATGAQRSEPLPNPSGRLSEGRQFSRPLPPDARPVPGALPSVAREPAREAIQQVRSAIGFLASSAVLTAPKREALQQVLRAIEPRLNQVVEKLEQSAQGKRVASLAEHADRPLGQQLARPVPVREASEPTQAAKPQSVPSPARGVGVAEEAVLTTAQRLDRPMLVGALPFPTNPAGAGTPHRKERRRPTPLPPPRENLWEKEREDEEEESEDD